MKLNEEEMYNAHLWLLTVPRVGISSYLPLPQTFSLKFLASFGRKVYFCIRLAALGNLKASFHCAHWHNLCIRLVALGNLKANFHCAHWHNL